MTVRSDKPQAGLPERSAGPPAPAATGPAPASSGVPEPYRDFDRTGRAAMAGLTGGISPLAAHHAVADWGLRMARSPGRQAELAEQAYLGWSRLAAHAAGIRDASGAEPPFSPAAYDHRFTHPGWQMPPFSLWQQGFLAAQQWWEDSTGSLSGLSREDADRNRFMMRQITDMISPSNFPWMNPEIIAATAGSGGKNLADGYRHFLEDFASCVNQKPKESPEGFRVGSEIACTTGEVVFRNELCELIQYSPRTAKVQAEPVLIVPAWIMKYYILDLSPQNSMVGWLLDQGFTVFVISWRNPGADQAELSLEDYRERGVMAAIDAVSAIVPERKIHATGYCLGGTILAIAAAAMARVGDQRLKSVTLLAAQVDFTEAGELLLFLDESQVALLEDMMWAKGYLAAPQMSGAFRAIRAEDLIYTRAVRRYFLGQEEMPTDIGVWNADSTRMPARMHSEYLRGLFLENRLSSGRFAVDGRIIALKDIEVPLFVVGTEKDHIAPWHSVYKTRLFTDADLTFVLASAGHNGGIVSEPGHPHRHYRISHFPSGSLYCGPDDWLKDQPPLEGSWWPEWSQWLRAFSGGPVTPPAMGSADFPPLCPAPGTYVMQK